MTEFEKLIKKLTEDSCVVSEVYLRILEEGLVNQQMPEKVYKYLDFQGGYLSLKYLNLQFSCPLSFYRTEHKLSDKSEFGIERVCIDRKLVVNLDNYITSDGEVGLIRRFSTTGDIGKVGYYVYRHLQTYFLGYGVCCLTQNAYNKRLWSDVSEFRGICIEYDLKTLLYHMNNISVLQHFANVIYVDKLEKTPISFNDESILKNYVVNLMFVKTRDFEFENEFRIVSRFEEPSEKLDVEKFLKNEILTEIPFTRYELGLNCVSRVFYTNHVENEKNLLDILERQKIPSKKIKF